MDGKAVKFRDTNNKMTTVMETSKTKVVFIVIHNYLQESLIWKESIPFDKIDYT